MNNLSRLRDRKSQPRASVKLIFIAILSTLRTTANYAQHLTYSALPLLSFFFSLYFVYIMAAVGSVDAMRALATPVFAQPQFRAVAWVGIFGRFARGQQDQESSVSVIVLTPLIQHKGVIEGALTSVWDRRVNVSVLKQGVTNKDVHFETVRAVVTSRTIFLRTEEARRDIMRIRQTSEGICAQVADVFGNIADRIEDLQNFVGPIDFEVGLAASASLLNILLLTRKSGV